MAIGKPASTPIHTKPWNLQGVVASPDGNWFVTGGYYGPELYTADAKPPPVHLNHTNLVWKSVFRPDNTMLLSVSWDQTARLWSLPRAQPLGMPLKHMAAVGECAWSHDARYVATAQNDGLIRVWQRPVDDVVIAQEYRWGQRPRVSFDGRLVVPGLWHEAPTDYGHQSVSRVRVVATANGQPSGADISLPGFLVDSCMCGDNRTVAAIFSRAEKGLLGVWDLGTSRALFDPVALPGPGISVAARSGSNQVAVLCTTGDLLVIDSRTGQSVFQRRHEGSSRDREPRSRVRYTPDGKTLVSLGSGPNGALHVRDADTGELRFPSSIPVLRPGDHCRSFAISADSRLVATMVNGKNAVQVWDLATGRALSKPLPHPGDFYGLFSVCFSPDGRYLLDLRSEAWERLEPILELFELASRRGERPALDALLPALEPAQRRVLLGDVASRQQVAELRGHTDYVHAVAWSPDGTRLVSGSGDFTVRVWDSLSPAVRARPPDALHLPR
jgi:WD40 repeat protein